MQIKNEKKHREAFFFYKRLVVYSSRSLVLTNLCPLNIEHIHFNINAAKLLLFYELCK